MADLDQNAARARAEELNQALAPGDEHRWIAHRARSGRWQVAQVSATGIPGRATRPETHGERGLERDDPPDPRSTLQRLIPPYGPS